MALDTTCDERLLGGYPLETLQADTIFMAHRLVEQAEKPTTLEGLRILIDNAKRLVANAKQMVTRTE